jgi:hypothetical protein
LHLEFTHIFTTNFVGSLDIRASREVFPIEVRSPEIINFTPPESLWFDSFYLPMEEKLTRFNKKYQGNEVALGIFEEMKNEINLYKKFSDFFGYEFFIMQRIN